MKEMQLYLSVRARRPAMMRLPGRPTQRSGILAINDLEVWDCDHDHKTERDARVCAQQTLQFLIDLGWAKRMNEGIDLSSFDRPALRSDPDLPRYAICCRP